MKHHGGQATGERSLARHHRAVCGVGVKGSCTHHFEGLHRRASGARYVGDGQQGLQRNHLELFDSGEWWRSDVRTEALQRCVHVLTILNEVLHVYHVVELADGPVQPSERVGLRPATGGGAHRETDRDDGSRLRVRLHGRRTNNMTSERRRQNAETASRIGTRSVRTPNLGH